MSASADNQEAGASALLQFCLLAKSAKGAQCVSLISQALEHPAITVFAELLDMQNIQSLKGSDCAPSLELLKLFAYGTWSDYKEQAAQLPALSEAQAKKLKKLTVVTFCSQSKTLPYATLMRELEVSTVRQVENLLIECLYEGLIQGKLDQCANQLDVHYCIGRDIHPSEVNSMCDLLANWHRNSIELLGSMRDKLDMYKAECDDFRNQQLELDGRIETVRANVRSASADAADFGGGSADSDIYDVRFDEDNEKMRKSGRSKGKQFAVGPRK